MNEFEKELKQALDDRAGELDAATLSRLHRARENALDTPVPWWRSLQARAGATVEMGGVLSHHPAPAAMILGILALITLLILIPLFTSSPGTGSSETLELMEILILDADLELVEDMDFYHWLEEQAPGAAAQ
jgi:hypothetical protein